MIEQQYQIKKTLQEKNGTLWSFEKGDLKALQLLMNEFCLKGKNILDLGFPCDLYVNLLLKADPKEYLAIGPYRESKFSIPDEENIQIRFGDFSLGFYDFLKQNDWFLFAFSNSSHEIQFIRREIINKYSLKGIILIIPREETVDFAGYRHCLDLQLNGVEFVVIADGIIEQGEKQHLSLIEQVRKAIKYPPIEKKLGTKRRCALLMSKNPNKLPEFEENCRTYGIEVYSIPPCWDFQFFLSILNLEIENVKILGIMREKSEVLEVESEIRSSFKNLSVVNHRSVLDVYFLSKHRYLSCRSYSYNTLGNIDLKRRKKEDQNKEVFGWDDIFVVFELNKTYQELKEMGRKVSSRDMNLSKYIKDRLHYQKPINLKWAKKQNKEVIDFSYSVIDFVDDNPLLGNTLAKENGIFSLFQASAHSGIFFRAAQNRRQKNYWWPGLNAGLPFTPKRDQIHETTYMAHDFFHFIIPDLIYTGENQLLKKQVYIIYRMMSEAITMVMADMLFVSTLKMSVSEEYDFDKRCLLPLFECTQIQINSKEDIKNNLIKLLQANIQYCLLGDDSGWRELIGSNEKSEKALITYKNKYMPFFVEDYRWTNRNYDQLAKNSDELNRWWDLTKPIRKSVKLDLETIDEFISRLGLEQINECNTITGLINQIFHAIYSERILPLFDRPYFEKSDSQQKKYGLQKAFARYLIGQLGLHARYDYLEESTWNAQRLIEYYLDELDTFDLENTETSRKYYNAFVDLLIKKNLISIDDGLTYKDVFPLFTPYYVHYDETKEFYMDLAQLSECILMGKYK